MAGRVGQPTSQQSQPGSSMFAVFGGSLDAAFLGVIGAISFAFIAFTVCAWWRIRSAATRSSRNRRILGNEFLGDDRAETHPDFNRRFDGTVDPRAVDNTMQGATTLPTMPTDTLGDRTMATMPLDDRTLATMDNDATLDHHGEEESPYQPAIALARRPIGARNPKQYHVGPSGSIEYGQ